MKLETWLGSCCAVLSLGFPCTPGKKVLESGYGVVHV